MARIRFSVRLLFASLLLFVTPLFAQLNPTSAWQVGDKTDFLDLFQGASSTGIKPEILLVIDDSGSTGRLMFHPLFPNNWQDENPGGGGLNGSTDITLQFYNSGWPNTNDASLTNSLTVGFGNTTSTSAPTAAPTSSFVASGNTYYLYQYSAVGGWAAGGARSTITIGSKTYPFNTLIKPNGTEVTETDLNTAGMRANRLNGIAWMRCASHIRYCVGAYKVGSGSTVVLATPRIVDVPLPWAPLDATGLQVSGSPAAISAVANVPNATWHGLTPTLAPDNVATTPAVYQVDLDTSTTTPTWDTYTTTTAVKGVCVYGGFSTSGYLNIRTRYLEWLFAGQDPNSPSTGTASGPFDNHYYCIPNAIPSNTTDLRVQRSIDPDSITYDGASDSYSWTYIDETSSKSYIDLTKGWVTAFDNHLPCRSRVQAIKEGVIKTWLTYQKTVMFAYRFLSSNTFSNTLDWTYINSVTDLSGIQTLSPNNTTPLIQSFVNAYCQMTNPAAFSAQIATAGYTASQLECQHHFVIVMTDGAPGPSQTEGACQPYSQTAALSCAGTYTAGSVPAYSGNNAVKANNSLITATSGAGWNAGTLAGIAAHGADPNISSTGWIANPLTQLYTSGTPGSTIANWLPFFVTRRTVGGTIVTLKSGQPIQTMTVGVSLGVNFLQTPGGTVWTNTYGATKFPDVRTSKVAIQSDTTGSKYRLLSAAYFGDPASTSYDITTAGPFYLPYGVTDKPADAAYFFDGRDPNTLINNLDDAFKEIAKIAKINTTAAPVFPTIGGGLGAEVYIGKFLPSGNSGPLWTGDLLMFPTKETSTGTRLIANDGTPLTGDLNQGNAQWSAMKALADRGWAKRTIYTRVAATSGVWNPPLLRVNLGTNGNNWSDTGFIAISSLLPGATTTVKQQNWQYFTGADLGSGSVPLLTRYDNIMGDIIGSAPAVLEYSTLPASITNAVSSTLYNAWTTHTSPRFRMIFVGTNQGFMHAFGEVSWTDTTTNPSVPVSKGVVDELWAFVPTEVVPYIDQLQGSSKKHRFSVDGAPTIYLLDRPQTASQPSGNGKFDIGATNAERALVIFGLGKGGRSYYAIKIEDPVVPVMQWSMCPDESNNYPTSRIKSGTAATISKMGLSTCMPTIARVATGVENTSKPNMIVDAVLLGGGYSDKNMEAALPGTPTTGLTAGTALGRSAIAIEVYTGDILHVWDTSGTSGAGPVPAGVVPHEYAEGSGLHQRAYFTDMYGGLWALGSTTMRGMESGVDYSMFRLDSANVDTWTARNVYRQTVASTAVGNGVMTTLPVPFNLPYFPVVRTTAPKIMPGAVGVAFVTGDRNNPLDDISFTYWAKPTQHRVNVLFDRQDVNTTLADTSLADASGSSFTTDTTSATYYLKTGSGYYINFPAGGTFVSKGIVSPLLIDGALFYSYFNPTTSSCAGGTGITNTFRVCNVLKPVVNSSTNWGATDASTVTPVNGCYSGMIISWSGVASTLSLRSILTGVQAGMTGGTGVNLNPTSAQNLVLQDLATQGTSAFAKIRVWRTVH